MEAELADSKSTKRQRLSDNYNQTSTSRMASPSEFSQVITNTGCTYSNSTIVTKQITNQTIAKTTSKLVLEQLDGFPFTSDVFVGRDEAMSELLKLYQKHQRVMITGIGGMGKTRLAIECARQWVDAGDFNRAVFINVETEEESKERFRSFGERLNVNPEVTNIYKYFNDEETGLTLFVLDNVERTNNIKKYLPPKYFKNIKILATSQDSEYKLLFTEFKLHKLAEDKAVDLMMGLLKKYQSDMEDNEIMRSHLLSVEDKDPCIRKLVKALEGHPLALQHACAFCVDSILYESEDDLSDCINKYVDQLNVKISEEFPVEYEVEYNKTIFTSISLNINKAITKSHVRDFLFTMCFMNPTLIELKYFRNCGRFSEDEIKDCKRTLLKHSIIHFMDDGLEDINVHRLVLVIGLTLLRKDNLEVDIVGINLSMHFSDRRAYICHCPFLRMHTNLEKNYLAGLYIKAFKKSPFMSKLSTSLQQVDLTVEDLEGWSVLHYCEFAEHNFWFTYFTDLPKAIESKNLNADWPLEIVERLKRKNVQYSFDIDTSSKTVVKDLIPLHFYAAFGCSLKYFQRIIDNIEDKEIETSSKLFHLATHNQRYHFGFELLTRGAKYEDKDKALTCAVLGGDLDLTRTLIEEGADVNFTDDAGLSPIFFAVATANDVILNELLQHGANIETTLNVKDGIKSTAFLSSIKGDFVASNDNTNEEFLFALNVLSYDYFDFKRSEAQVLTAVKLLIKIGANVNCFNSDNETPLMIALQECYVNVAVKIIEGGADVNKTDKCGSTPLMLAMNRKLDGSLVKLLEERTSIHEGYNQNAPSTADSDAKEPEKCFSTCKLPDLIDLYDKFVNLKFEVVLNPGAFISEKTPETNETDVQSNAAQRVHQELAVRLLLPEEKSLPGLEELKKFKANYENGEEELFRVGILTLEEGQLKFSKPYLSIYFAEYFLTEYLISYLNSEIVQKLFLHQILTEDNFELTRGFFDSHLGLYFNDASKTKKLVNEQLPNLKRNRFHILSVVEFTERVKDSVRFALQEDNDFLLLKRVAWEDRTHILKYLLNQFKSDIDILLGMLNKIGKYGGTTLHEVANKGGSETLNVILEFLGKNLDPENLKSILGKGDQCGRTVVDILCLRGRTEMFKIFLNFLKENLDQENLKSYLLKTDGRGNKILHILSEQDETESHKVFLDFLNENLDQENLKVLLEKRNEDGKTAVDIEGVYSILSTLSC